MKFCKDCKWVEREGWIFKTVRSYASCANPVVGFYEPATRDPVTGAMIAARMWYASAARLPHAPCGTDGKLFEART
jgi:hypothetical protein